MTMGFDTFCAGGAVNTSKFLTEERHQNVADHHTLPKIEILAAPILIKSTPAGRPHTFTKRFAKVLSTIRRTGERAKILEIHKTPFK
jgi:hypothetical protein